MSKITYITAEELKAKFNKSQIKLIDIREVDEFKVEHIANADNLPLSKFNSESLENSVADENVVFYCQAGNRTKQCESQLKALPIDEVMVLSGGIVAWKKLGYEVVKNAKAKLPIMRQVQMIAGILILIGAILGLTISPYFILISAFVGAGLTFAGITGFCGLANVLMLLPYNKD